MTVERIFVGISLTEGVRRLLRERLARLELPGRPVPPENWHLTLRFLGSTPPEARERLVRSLGTAKLGGPVAIAFGGLAAFPRPGRTSVLWLGLIEGAEGIRRLGAAVEEAARRAGFPAESRHLVPHLTLSRLPRPVDVRQLLANTPVVGGEMRVDAVTVFRSHLGNGPARYEEVERFSLMAGG